ncbi:MAG: hypothetical protein SFX74_09660 [Fimbriimonadaceae bacterium]|nr:hypothetical protein [Fimbriimonadaceae bacterium]
MDESPRIPAPATREQVRAWVAGLAEVNAFQLNEVRERTPAARFHLLENHLSLLSNIGKLPAETRDWEDHVRWSEVQSHVATKAA